MIQELKPKKYNGFYVRVFSISKNDPLLQSYLKKHYGYKTACVMCLDSIGVDTEVPACEFEPLKTVIKVYFYERRLKNYVL